jgi:hypothetical protein
LSFLPVVYTRRDLSAPGYIEHLAPCTRWDTSSLLQAWPALRWDARASHVSGGHFLCLLLLVLSRSYSLYSGDHFLFYVSVISVFSVFTYLHCAHTRSRCALLVYLGERTGSLSGLISLSISDFSIGSVQSHHIYVFCTSSLPRSVFGGTYIYLRTRRSSDPPDTSIPGASK